MQLHRCIFLAALTAGSPALAQAVATSFEASRPGSIGSLELPGFSLQTPATGHAAIDAAHAHTGERCLHILGGDAHSVEVVPTRPTHLHRMTFWAERWTRRAPFRFRVEARVAGTWREVYRGDDQIVIGGFKTQVVVPLDAVVERLRLTCTAPPRSGILIDDLTLEPPAKMQLVQVESHAPRVPVLVGADANPVLEVRIETSGNTHPLSLRRLRIHTGGTTRLKDITEVRLLSTGNSPRFRAWRQGRAQQPAEIVDLQERIELLPGINHFWVSYSVASNADLDHLVDATCTEVQIGAKVIEPERADAKYPARLGLALRRHREGGVHTHRIPGLATSNVGTLLAVYDLRHRGSRDLPGDIDVGLSRSTDGGRTWEPMRKILDMGEPHRGNGVGDPAITVDRKTGTIFVAGLWSQGNRAWFGSRPGLTPDETGQLVLTKSEDDGRTWGAPINITRQIKKPEWRLLLQGPGKGITLRDGTLVFPAQYKDAKGLPHSTVIHSRDRGKTWRCGTSARPNTTEAQCVQLRDGSIMLNMRDNRGGARAVMVTDDLGKTWRPHPTSRKALPEPVCMASLIRFSDQLLLFANPNVDRAPRRRITIQASRDDGATWTGRLLLDAGSGRGYSCMTRIDADHVGIVYESSRADLVFQRIPVAAIR